MMQIFNSQLEYTMKYTPWFPGTVKPVRFGVYQRRLANTDIAFSYWDGEQWFLANRTPYEAFGEPALSFNQDGFEWRGLRHEAQ